MVIVGKFVLLKIVGWLLKNVVLVLCFFSVFSMVVWSLVCFIVLLLFLVDVVVYSLVFLEDVYVVFV